MKKTNDAMAIALVYPQISKLMIEAQRKSILLVIQHFLHSIIVEFKAKLLQFYDQIILSITNVSHNVFNIGGVTTISGWFTQETSFILEELSPIETVGLLRYQLDFKYVVDHLINVESDNNSTFRNIYPKEKGSFAKNCKRNLYALGDTDFLAFNSQLQSKLNYVTNYTYNKVTSIDLLQFEEQINNYAAVQLKSIVDVFCIGSISGGLDARVLTKIKDFAQFFGVVVDLFNNATNAPISKAQPARRVSNSQLLSATTILAKQEGISTL